MQTASAVADADGNLLIVLHGNVDFTNASEVMEAVADVSGVSGPDVAVDLGEVTFLDSSGIAVLVRLLYLAERHGGRLSLLSPTSRVQDQLHLAGLSALLGPEAGPPSWLTRLTGGDRPGA